MDMLETRIAGIPCQVEITYSPGTNFQITSASLEPNDPEEFEIVGVQDMRGYSAPWLERKITRDDEDRIYAEYKEAKRNEVWEPY